MSSYIKNGVLLPVDYDFNPQTNTITARTTAQDVAAAVEESATYAAIADIPVTAAAPSEADDGATESAEISTFVTDEETGVQQ